VFVGGTREVKSVGLGRERSAGRGPHTLTQIAHASRDTLALTLPRPLTLAGLG
jgi:hypothetical protein